MKEKTETMEEKTISCEIFLDNFKGENNTMVLDEKMENFLTEISNDKEKLKKVFQQIANNQNIQIVEEDKPICFFQKIIIGIFAFIVLFLGTALVLTITSTIAYIIHHNYCEQPSKINEQVKNGCRLENIETENNTSTVSKHNTMCSNLEDIVNFQLKLMNKGLLNE